MKNSLITIFFLTLFSSSAFAKYTLIKDMTVKQMTYEEEKKMYLVDFVNQSGRYHGKPRDAACFKHSMEKNVPVKVEFVAMGLAIIDCQKVESK
jgi:hypothetical protein